MVAAGGPGGGGQLLSSDEEDGAVGMSLEQEAANIRAAEAAEAAESMMEQERAMGHEASLSFALGKFAAGIAIYRVLSPLDPTRTTNAKGTLLFLDLVELRSFGTFVPAPG